MTAAAAALESFLGQEPRRLTPLSGGCIAEVYRLDLKDGTRLVAKLAPQGGLDLEAFMLRYLAQHSELPVPAVIKADDRHLVMEYVETAGSIDASAEVHAAELLAALHDVASPRFGFERDTLIGPLPLPNAWSDDWITFFGERRLLHFGRLAHDAGHLSAATLHKLDTFTARLPDLIGPATTPSLLHGDLWGGNILVRSGGIAAFIDPAIYYGSAEADLAFSTLFGSFGEAFFRRYHELRPLPPGFFEVRRDIYNLYPLLVHARLFGGHYGAQVGRILERFL